MMMGVGVGVGVGVSRGDATVVQPWKTDKRPTARCWESAVLVAAAVGWYKVVPIYVVNVIGSLDRRGTGATTEYVT